MGGSIRNTQFNIIYVMRSSCQHWIVPDKRTGIKSALGTHP